MENKDSSKELFDTQLFEKKAVHVFDGQNEKYFILHIVFAFGPDFTETKPVNMDTLKEQ